jgi:hypothetical protein
VQCKCCHCVCVWYCFYMSAVQLETERTLQRSTPAHVCTSLHCYYSAYALLRCNAASPTTHTESILALQVDCVAAADAANFKLHPSVEFWANYNTSFSSRSLNAQADDPNASR